jgi:hypothetical protein
LPLGSPICPQILSIRGPKLRSWQETWESRTLSLLPFGGRRSTSGINPLPSGTISAISPTYYRPQKPRTPKGTIVNGSQRTTSFTVVVLGASYAGKSKTRHVSLIHSAHTTYYSAKAQNGSPARGKLSEGWRVGVIGRNTCASLSSHFLRLVDYSRLQIDGSFLKKRTQESLFTCGARHFGSNWKWRETPTNSGLKGAGTRGCRHDPTVRKITMLLAHSPPPPLCKCGQLAARYCPSGFFAEIAADVPPGQRLFFCFRLVPAIDMQGNAPHSAVIGLRMVEHELAIKAGQRVRPFATTMPSKRPPHMSPEEWREYLRCWPRMSWWLRDVDGNHPDYPGMPQNSESTDDSPPHDRTPSPPQQSFLASLTSRSHLPPLSPLPFSQWACQQGSL